MCAASSRLSLLSTTLYSFNPIVRNSPCWLHTVTHLPRPSAPLVWISFFTSVSVASYLLSLLPVCLFTPTVHILCQIWGLTSTKVVVQAMILLPVKNPATNYRTGSDSYLSVQSSYNGRDICSSVPESNDPLSVISDSVQFCGHNYLQLFPTNTSTAVHL